MKLKGKIKDLRDILKRSGCGGMFDPVTFEFKDDEIVVKMREEANAGMILGKFDALDIEDVEEGEELILDTEDLIDQIKVIPGSSDFVAVMTDDTLEVKTENEMVKFHMESDWQEKSISPDNIPVKHKDDGKYYSSTKLTAGVKMKSNELSKIISRMDTVGVKFMKLELDDGDVKSTIGDLTSSEYHPRTYNPTAEIMVSEGDETMETSFGVKKVANVVSGEIELYFSKDSPLVIFDEGEDYKTAYVLAPVEKEEG